MKNDNKKRPTEAELDDVMFSEAGSAMECTGLIPSAVLNDSEYGAYDELMDFGVPEIYKKL